MQVIGIWSRLGDYVPCHEILSSGDAFGLLMLNAGQCIRVIAIEGKDGRTAPRSAFQRSKSTATVLPPHTTTPTRSDFSGR
jgi:hypothetical protein